MTNSIDERLERLRQKPKFGQRAPKVSHRPRRSALQAVDFFSPHLTKAKNVLDAALKIRDKNAAPVDPVTFKAAQEVFDRVFGRPTQDVNLTQDEPLEVEHTHDLSGLSAVELAGLYRQAVTPVARVSGKRARSGDRT